MLFILLLFPLISMIRFQRIFTEFCSILRRLLRRHRRQTQDAGRSAPRNGVSSAVEPHDLTPRGNHSFRPVEAPTPPRRPPAGWRRTARRHLFQPVRGPDSPGGPGGLAHEVTLEICNRKFVASTRPTLVLLRQKQH